MRPTTNFALHSALAAVLIAFAATSVAAANYMKYGTIKGEAAVTDGKVGDGWIQIDSFQWGVARQIQSPGDTASPGGNREAGAPGVSDLACVDPRAARELVCGELHDAQGGVRGQGSHRTQAGEPDALPPVRSGTYHPAFRPPP